MAKVSLTRPNYVPKLPSVEDLIDVVPTPGSPTTGPQDSDILIYSAALGKWVIYDSVTAVYQHRVYENVKVFDLLNIPDTVWTPVAQITIYDIDPGTYQFNHSIQGTFPVTGDSGLIRYRHNQWTGSPRTTLPWSIQSLEPKDPNQTLLWYYGYPKAFTERQNIQYEVEASKTPNGAEFNIQFADVWIERKK